MNDCQPPLPWAQGQETSGTFYHALFPYGILLIITNGPQPVRIIAYFDATIEYSVIESSVAQRLGIIVRPVPQQRSIMVPRVGLVTPEEWVAVNCDIPELGVIGKSINVQIAHWDDPLVHMYIGHRFLEQLPVRLPSLQEASRQSPPRARSDVAALSMAAQRLMPQLHVSGTPVVDSPGSAIAQHGNNSPPMRFANGFLSPPCHQLQINNSHLSSPLTQSNFGSSPGWAPISAPSNVFSFGTFPASSISSYQANCSPQGNNADAQAQAAGDAMGLSFDGQSFDDHCYDDMFNFSRQNGDEDFERF
ncbi:hypothetical protein QBC36DRAFT_46687 [Triangularia setosa]|uniref:Uncharacterized protein n=1 Tax=Triangularia setosa TaxID=2587417 RepID=A0AAN6WE17_9PEZI|nr:hypothetical protein QBC36DRAFT_46687 [Podospora setosa]